MANLTGLSALVTGGNRGLGFAIAQRLVHDGADLVIVGRNADSVDLAAEKLRAHGRVRGVVADVSTEDGLRDLFAQADEFGSRLDILVNNAGIADEAAFGDVTRANWERVIAVNLSAPFFLAQQAASRMTAGGAIVNITSIDAYGADGPFSSYVAAKAGLIGLTKAAAVELAPRGIRVNAVSPGWTLTDMAAEATSEAMLAHMRGDFSRVPLRRLLTPEEIASAVAYLVSPEASGVTGVDLIVDGGTLANLYILETLPEESS
ncbi:SDR family NAD(P)-dependent oxidoreductase [Pedococcus sp. NPDC057267]|uniref:SDR family NAD(P)-dependent oxidoreductase n=1 Tax=Pedococcus sp. NPDC057267 TaxID=3346077 RepID=UPI003629A7B0